MTEIKPTSISQVGASNKPNFPASVRERYAAEDLEHASAQTVGIIMDELAMLTQYEVKSSPTLVGAEAKTEDGGLLSVISTEDWSAHFPSTNIRTQGLYSPNPNDRVPNRSVPHFLISTRERINSSYELSLPKDPHARNHLATNYWVYDRPVGSKTKDSEPVIYRVPSMITDKNDSLVSTTGIDRQEFELALKSGNLHRLTETEAKDLLRKIQSVEPVSNDRLQDEPNQTSLRELKQHTKNALRTKQSSTALGISAVGAIVGYRLGKNKFSKSIGTAAGAALGHRLGTALTARRRSTRVAPASNIPKQVVNK